MKKALFFLLFLTLFQSVYAQEIMFSSEHSEYFIKIGQPAILPIKINNEYGHKISGILQYTITQQVFQKNFQFENTGTSSKTFSIEEGEYNITLNLGTSDAPSDLTLNLSFHYNDGQDKVVLLGPIIVHFVDNPPKNNPSTSIQGSSQRESSSQSSFSSPQKFQEQFDQLFNNQKLSQNPQNRLQNNQLTQDSLALKKQIQNQLQKEQQSQEQFKKQIASNQEFLRHHRQLLQNGYNVTSAKFNPENNSTGNFEINYKNSEGKWASIQGKMVNGTIDDLNIQSQEMQERLLRKLQQNSEFQSLDQQLTQRGFSKNDIKFDTIQNKTKLDIVYADNENNKAKISALFENDNIEEITFDEDTKNNSVWFIILFSTAAIIGSIIFFLVKRFSNKQSKSLTIPTNDSKLFDHILESKKLISNSIKYYEQGNHKEAFATAARAIRLFLRCEMGMDKELTNTELLNHLKHTSYPYDEIKGCLEIVNLVEFAKLDSSKESFQKIISLFNKILNMKKSIKSHPITNRSYMTS